MNECWQTLGIEPFADKKTIKRAYARLLKLNRPDDDPQAFRTLHDAYKQALVYSETTWQWDEPEALEQPEQEPPPFAEAERVESVEMLIQPNPLPEPEPSAQVEVSLPEPPETNAVDTGETVEISLAAPAAEVLPEPVESTNTQAELSDADWFPNRDADWEALFEQVNVTFQAKNAGSDVEQWKFIERNPSLLDLEFRAEASDRLFEMVAEANEIALQKKTLFFKPPVLNYFNQVFAWDSKWREYNQMFPASQLDAVLPYLQSQNVNAKPKHRPVQPQDLHYYARIFAFLLDALLLGMFLFALGKTLEAAGVLKDTFITIMISSSFAYFLLIIPLLEASPWQASPGKKLLGLRVVNGKGGRLSWYHSLIRGVFASICLLGIKVTVWINFFMARYKNMLLQDWLSRSYVIKG